MTRASDNTLSSDHFYTDLSVGEILRRARMHTGQSIDDVATTLRIRASHLDALERSDFESLPGRVYVIGFVRTYAEYLNLDGGRVVELLKRQSRGLTTPQEMNGFAPVSESRLPSVSIVAAAFGAIMITVLMWIAYNNARLSGVDELPSVPAQVKSMSEIEKLSIPDTPNDMDLPEASDVVTDPATPAADAATPTTEPVVAAPKAAPTPAIQIVLLDDSWLEVRNPEGRVVEARLFRKGEVFPVAEPVDEFGHSFAVTMGNAAGVQILVAGKALPPLGNVNQVRRNIPLNPATLKALMAN